MRAPNIFAQISWKSPHFHGKSTAYLRHSCRRGARDHILKSGAAAALIRLAKAGRCGV